MLRYVFGLLGASAIVLIQGVPVGVHSGDILGLVLLALVPGLLALGLYYIGLQATPGRARDPGRTGLPGHRGAVGVTVLGATFTVSQWIGFAVVLLAVTGLGWHERRARSAMVATATVELAPAEIN